MIIEWIGCSGAGKTTLSKEVYKNLLESGFPVRRPLEIFIGKNLAKLISSERLRNIILDILVLPWTFFSIIKYKRFLLYCLKFLRNDYFSFTQRIKLIRSILRKTGLHFFLENFCNKKQLIFVDEGTVHIAHLLFANGNISCVLDKDVADFCDCVPIPDLIVHIMSSESELIERTLNREHKPIPTNSLDSLERFISLGFETFKLLDELNSWGKKIATFPNPRNKPGEENGNILKITNQIANTFPSLRK